MLHNTSKNKHMKENGFETKAIHAGYDEFEPGTMVTPLYQTVAYPYADAKEAAEIFNGNKPGYTYGRWDNPTVTSFETRMAALENTESAIATSSGMAAILLLCHTLLEAGDNIVSSNLVYGGTFSLFEVGLKKMGINTTWVRTPDNIDTWEKSITARTKMIFVETPGNPSLYIADIEALSRLAKSKNIPLVVDSTVASPALQRATDFGANIIVHSTTKYICGNGTSLGGIICGPKEIIEGKIRKSSLRYMGPSIAPFNAWLNLLGLETLALRMQKHSSNALAVALFLDNHPKVKSVNYPGLKSNPYNEMANKQMKGFSSLLSFVLEGGYEQATTFIDSLNIFIHATHLGTCKSIATHPASTTHSAMGEEEMAKAGISPAMIRFSVGIEDENDLIADLQQAFEKTY